MNTTPTDVRLNMDELRDNIKILIDYKNTTFNQKIIKHIDNQIKDYMDLLYKLTTNEVKV